MINSGLETFSVKQGNLLALIAGCSLPLAFAPFELYPFAFIAPAILFALWSKATPKDALIKGALFGVGMFGLGVSWVYVSMHDYGYVDWISSVLLTALLVLVLSSFTALAGYLSVRLFPASTNRATIRLIIVIPAMWTLMEWVRGWFLTGFPWLNLGYSQIDAPLAGVAPVLGVYGVSLVAAISSALLAVALANRNGEIKGVYLLGLLGLWMLVALAGKVTWTQAIDDPLKISMVQGNIPQELKWHPGMRQPTIELYTRMTRMHWDSDLIIWPESALPTFYDESIPLLDSLDQEARENNTDMLVGIIYQEDYTQPYYNSMISVGSKRAVYHKHHLVPFTEFLPMKTVLADIVDFIDVPMSDFSRGAIDQLPLEVAGQKVGISICYEDAFGEQVIQALPEATLLVNVSNDAWFGGSIAPHQHLQIARMRALETGRYLLRATNTGISAIIDTRGDFQKIAPQFTETVLTDDVQAMKGATPYVRFGNLAVLIIIGGMLIVGYLLLRQTNRT